MLKKLAVISLAAGALVLCAPVAASAAPSDSAPLIAHSYAEPPDVTVDHPVIDRCEVSSIVFGAGFFDPGEDVSVGISGSNAAGASYSGNVADDTGALALTFRPPADGDARYAVSLDGSRSYTAQITVSHGQDAAASCDHDPAVAAGLARTGGGVSPWMIGGGAMALLAGGVLVTAAARRPGHH
ncbi:hypothetical protein [Microbacterium abyssi]|uniref:hypothetical protein n=1 Tax=Microbacterium abyssi TaxID=2782166 RepID=UPI00188761EF|nr:hypothetical protein [Microbacterium sp. A18JL241]